MPAWPASSPLHLDLPRVIDIPSQLYLARGMLGRIDCPVDANPPLTMVVWSKGKRQVNVAHQRHVRVNKHGTLILRPVTNGDEGVYSCIPYSPLGKGESSTPVQVFVRGDDPRGYTPVNLLRCEPKNFYSANQLLTADRNSANHFLSPKFLVYAPIYCMS